SLTDHRAPPANRILDLHLQASLGRPSQIALCLGDAAHELGRIARPARAEDMRHRPADGAADLLDDLLDAVAGAGSQVEDIVTATAGFLAHQPLAGLEGRGGAV